LRVQALLSGTHEDHFLSREHSALIQKLRRVTFISFGGDIKLLIPGGPGLKLTLAFSGPLLATIMVNPLGKTLDPNALRLEIQTHKAIHAVLHWHGYGIDHLPSGMNMCCLAITILALKN